MSKARFREDEKERKWEQVRAQGGSEIAAD